MFGLFSALPAMIQARAQERERQARFELFMREADAIREHDERIASSRTLNGKAFKCGPWRWRMRTIPGAVLMWTERV